MRSAFRGPARPAPSISGAHAYCACVLIIAPMAIMAQATSRPCTSNCTSAEGLHFSAFHFLIIYSYSPPIINQHPSYLVPFPVQILSLFLAFATRRVKVKGLNDTKAVAGAVYVTSITFTVLFVCTYSVVQYINVYAAIFCVAFFIGTTTILALLYIPKVSGCVSMNCLVWL